MRAAKLALPALAALGLVLAACGKKEEAAEAPAAGAMGADATATAPADPTTPDQAAGPGNPAPGMADGAADGPTTSADMTTPPAGPAAPADAQAAGASGVGGTSGGSAGSANSTVPGQTK